MQFFTLLAVLAAPLVAVAQNSTSFGPNYFTLDSSFAATAGQPSSLKWTPTTGGTVTLVLRSGASSNLNTGLVIQKGIANTGSYTWQVPSMITRGSDYALEIISDQDPSVNNYYGPFVIESTYTVTTSAGATTTNSLFSSLTIPTASSTLRSSSASSSVTLLTGSVTSTSSTASSSTGTSSTAPSTNTGAGFQATTSSKPNSAPRPTAMAGMAGMLGMVALGALAL